MKLKNNSIKIILSFFLFCIYMNAQSLKILKDSVLIDNAYFELQELKIISHNNEVNNKIYKIIQNTYEIFEKPFFCLPEQRIKFKKNNISNLILENNFRESNFGFEDYKIYYDKNNIINISIAIQSYGSPWEGIQYYCFDLNNGKRIGVNLFINPQILLKKIEKKLKEQDISLPIKTSSLLNFKIITDKNKNISGFDFLIFDTTDHRNSGYEEYVVHFEIKEIVKYISSFYKKRLLNR